MSAPFNEVEMMILAKLSYFKAPGTYKSDGTAVKPCSLYDMLDTYKEDLTDEFDAKAVSKLMKKVEGQDYTVIKAVDNTYASGFEAIAIEGPDSSTVTVAARGSEGIGEGDLEDLVQDWGIADFIGLGVQSESWQQADMNAFMKSLNKYDSIYLTGHSLGGNLAISGAVGFDDPDKIKGVYTYNAPRQNAAYWLKHAIGIAKVKDKVTNYRTEGDMVSDINIPFGKTVTVKSRGKGNAHLLSDFSRNGSEFIISKTGKSIGHTAFSGFTILVTSILSLNPSISMYINSYYLLYKLVGSGIYNLLDQKAVSVTGNKSDFIFVNTDGLMDEAKKMRSYQQEYTEIMQKITNLIITLQQDHVWDTTATTTFINNYLDLKNVFDKFGQIMTEYAAMMESVSDRMQSADNSFASKFNSLSV